MAPDRTKLNGDLTIKKACLYLATAVLIYHILFFQSEDPVTSTSFSNHERLDFSVGQIRGAAMMLVSKPWTIQRGERQCFFNRSMDALSSHWLPRNPYPVILQHPDGWTVEEMRDIRQQWPQFKFYFSNIGNAFHIDPPKNMEDQDQPLSPLGYKKMCAYKTFGFLNAPFIATQELDYIFYLDDDSCLTEPIHYNVFEKMQQHKIAYAYKQLFLDRDHVVRGLVEFVENYRKSHKSLPYANPSLAKWLEEHEFLTKDGGGGSHWTFATNLEWLDLKQYRQSDTVAFLNAIADSGMIFHRRWGDAPLRFVLAYLFLNNRQVMKICSSYVHSMWNPSPSTCSDQHQTPDIEDAVLRQLQGCFPKSTCN